MEGQDFQKCTRDLAKGSPLMNTPSPNNLVQLQRQNVVPTQSASGSIVVLHTCNQIMSLKESNSLYICTHVYNACEGSIQERKTVGHVPMLNSVHLWNCNILYVNYYLLCPENLLCRIEKNSLIDSQGPRNDILTSYSINRNYGFSHIFLLKKQVLRILQERLMLNSLYNGYNPLCCSL